MQNQSAPSVHPLLKAPSILSLHGRDSEREIATCRRGQVFEVASLHNSTPKDK